MEIKGLHNLHKSQEEKILCIMIARPPKVSIFPHSGLRPSPDGGLDDTGDYDIRLAGLMTLVMSVAPVLLSKKLQLRNQNKKLLSKAHLNGYFLDQKH